MTTPSKTIAPRAVQTSTQAQNQQPDREDLYTLHRFKTATGGEIVLNLSRNHREGSGSLEIDQDGLARIAALTRLHWNKPIQDGHLHQADQIFEDGVCLSPFSIFGPLHKQICDRFIISCSFTSELREELEEAGAFKFVEGVSDPSYSLAILDRILTVFAISAYGLTSVSEAPLAFIHTMVDFFRSADGLGWNEEIFGKNAMALQCIRQLVQGLSVIFNDPNLLKKSRRYRRPKKTYWSSFEISRDPLDIEIHKYYISFLEESLTSPSLIRETVLAVSAWLRMNFSRNTLVEISSCLNSNVSFSSFITKRNNTGATAHTLSLVSCARSFSLYVSEVLSRENGGRVLFDLISQKELNKIKNQVEAKPKPDRSTARPLPEKMILLLQEILDEGEHGWPGSCPKFQVDVVENGRKRRIYCPVIPTLFEAGLPSWL